MGRRSSTSSRCFGVRERSPASDDATRRRPRRKRRTSLSGGSRVRRADRRGLGGARNPAAGPMRDPCRSPPVHAAAHAGATRDNRVACRGAADGAPATGGRGCGVRRNRRGLGRAPGGLRREMKRAGRRGVDGRVSIVPLDAITSARILMEHRSHGPVPRGTLDRLGLRPDRVSRLEGHAASSPVIFPSLPLCGNVGAVQLTSRNAATREDASPPDARRLPARARRGRRPFVVLLRHATPDA